MMLKHLALFALLFLFACNSPEARLERAQHDFWEKYAQHDFFEIKLKNEVLHLPLPPSSAPSEQQKSWAESLQKEVHSIEKEDLSEGSQKQLAQLCSALDDCVVHAGNAFFDPSRCVVLRHLQQFSEQPELSLLLEKIPDYYAQIEQRWQIPDARFVPKAVEESQTTLDLLNTFEKNSGGKIVAQTGVARAAVKDFIGLCQSAILQ
jgi:hypothetical protein